MTPEAFLDSFGHLADAPNGVEQLRQLVLNLAVQGALVPQDHNDETALDLLGAIAAEVLASDFSSGDPEIVTDAERLNWGYDFTIPSSWAWCRLEHLASYIQRGKGPKYVDKSSVPVISQKCIQWEGFDIGRARFLSVDALEKYQAERFLREGDLLWNSTGTGTIGRINVFPGAEVSFDKVVADSHVTVIRPVRVLPRFLWIWVACPFIQRTIESDASGTTNQVELSKARVTSQPVPLPPLAEQHRIVEKVDQLMALCDELEQRRTTAASTRRQFQVAALDRLTNAETPDDLAAAWTRVRDRFDLLTEPAAAKQSVESMRKAILKLAVSGNLVDQRPTDERASEILTRTLAAKEDAETRSKRGNRSSSPKIDPAQHIRIPDTWVWAPFGQIVISRDHARIPLSKDDRSKRAKVYDYYGASGVIDKVDDYLFDKPLLLIGEDGANLINRSTPIAFIARGRYWVNNHAHVLDAISEDILKYLEIYINSINLEPFVTGMAQPKMNQAKMNSIPVALPPEGEQRRIVEKVDQLMTLCDELATRLVAADQTAQRYAESATAAMVAA